MSQVLGPAPETHAITGTAGDQAPAEASAPFPSAARTVSFIDGHISFTIGESPHIGNPDAPHVLAEFFDYTCKSCRDMYGDMHALIDAHPDEFLVVLVPCPLNILCNPHFAGDSLEHANACDYARLALAVWRTAPEAFPEFHGYLMEGGAAPPLEEARERADSLAGSGALSRALQDPWTDARLQKTFSQYAVLVSQNPAMPKLLLGGRSVFHGLAKDTETFVGVMETRFELPPRGG